MVTYLNALIAITDLSWLRLLSDDVKQQSWSILNSNFKLAL